MYGHASAPEKETCAASPRLAEAFAANNNCSTAHAAILLKLLNGAASPANCAKKIAGPLIVVIAPSTPPCFGPTMIHRETLLYSFSTSKQILAEVRPGRVDRLRHDTRGTATCSFGHHAGGARLT